MSMTQTKKEIKISDQTCTDTDESTYAYFRERTFHSRYNENPQLEQVFACNSSDEWFDREQWGKTWDKTGTGKEDSVCGSIP